MESASDLLRLTRTTLAARRLSIGDAVLVRAGEGPRCAFELRTAWVADGVARTGWPRGRSVSVSAALANKLGGARRQASERLVGLGAPAVAEGIVLHVLREPAEPAPGGWAEGGDESDAGGASVWRARLCGLVVCAGARVTLDSLDGPSEVQVVSLAPSTARLARVLPCTRVRLATAAERAGALAARARAAAPAPERPAKPASAAPAPAPGSAEPGGAHRSGLRAQPGVQVLLRVRAICALCHARATGAAGAGGLRAPARAILLHGPPGVGKTHLVRALAAERGLPLIPIDAARLGADDDSVAAGLRGAFAAARRRAARELRAAREEAERAAPGARPPSRAALPVLLFADELDALCEAAGGAEAGGAQAGGAHGPALGARAACLCSLLEQLPPDGSCLLIGATNRLHALEPALLRSGRIDCALPVALGTPEERAGVLAAVSAGVALAPDVDVASVARALCHGFSQADCAALCRGAAMLALRRAAAPGGGDARVCLADFEAARPRMRPTVLRAVELAAAGGSWEGVGGQHAAKLQLRRAVEWPLTRAAALQRLGVHGARGILLHGPPGCSKTMLARTVAASVGCTFLHLSGASVYSPFVGEAEATIRATFQTAAACAPAVLFLDELDALVGARGARAGSSGADGVQTRVLSTLLTELDGVERAEGVILVGATNRIDLIDAALLRPGRLDVLIEVDLPAEGDRAEVLRVHSARMPLAPDVDLRALAARTRGLSAADLAQLCVHAALCALRRAHDGSASLERVPNVSAADFALALGSARASAARA